jgi:hypothetical protein
MIICCRDPEFGIQFDFTYIAFLAIPGWVLTIPGWVSSLILPIYLSWGDTRGTLGGQLGGNVLCSRLQRDRGRTQLDTYRSLCYHALRPEQQTEQQTKDRTT